MPNDKKYNLEERIARFGEAVIAYAKKIKDLKAEEVTYWAFVIGQFIRHSGFVIRHSILAAPNPFPDNRMHAQPAACLPKPVPPRPLDGNAARSLRAPRGSRTWPKASSDRARWLAC